MRTQKYFDGFKDRASLSQFFGYNADLPKDFPKESEILFAAYGQPCYEGYALVIFKKDGKLYEVNGAHCSCYGLEGQWKPEETSWAALKMRKLDGYHEYSAEAHHAFGVLVSKKRTS